jgi:SAM-dependent methyltransferase
MPGRTRVFLMGMLDSVGVLEPSRDLFNWFRYLLSFRVRRDNADFIRRGAPDGLPIPTPRLMHLVSGYYRLESLYTNGRHGAECIRRILERNGVVLESLGSIYDFGCGCGRVVRFWAGLGRPKVYGTDYNPDLVAWCSENLKFGTFSVNGLEGPLDFPDGKFDFVYAISVFTHLPDELQRSWLDELVRVTAPGGHLYITVLGTRHRAKLTDAEWARFNAGEMIVQWAGYPGTNICRVFHSERYFRERLVGEGRGAAVEVVDFVAGGAEDADRQDVFLLRKR